MPAEERGKGPIVTSTYRVQLTPEFGFGELSELTGYLRRLGVGGLYLSPTLQAVAGSQHGYDVTDHSRVRAEFGGVDGLRKLAGQGFRIVADIVPNHMTVPVPESGNAQLWSVLRLGPESPYAAWFDLTFPVALPVLGENPEFTVDGDVLRYWDHEFPLRPGTSALPLDELLEAQHYRLVPWTEPPGYRRFFDVSSLIGIRVEDNEVFEATHRVTLDLIDEGVIDGLRVDHPDGLADPRGYLRRLRAFTDVPVWVEKIVIGHERLPADWPCEGTTGYEALNAITRLFVDPAGADKLIQTFTQRTGVSADYGAVRYEAKKHVLSLFFKGEVDRLESALGEPGLHDAVVEMLAAMPVYRAYVNPGEPPSAEAVRIVETAAAEAGRRTDPGAVARVAHQVLYGPAEAVTRFQQTCGPVMAKGVEDTALYRWFPLACLNEVGGEPDHFAVTPEEFHAFCAVMTPTTMTTLSTHDTKRSEDVRARLAVLSELPDVWADAVESWSGQVRFDPALDYLAWQSLMAAWPIDVDRFTNYLLKAAREAKTSISWIKPDPVYEAGLRDFCRKAVEVCGFSVASFTAVVDRYARVNSLGQKVVQLLMPGIPDIYQGNETTDFSLVDPDNRRPVDYAFRRALLDNPDDDTWDGQKLQTVTACLRVRTRFSADEPYFPIEAGRNAIAFARGDKAVAVATRLPAALERRGGFGGDTVMLPPGRWRCLLTGAEHTGRVPLAHLLSRFPVAVLEGS
ncbi:malto-oligosyltrehalose synthase [Herbidospora galbida]|uniref:Malto-oligosyltrehalose synthase n=1 Tax=Herbidospora galbida TaxID=2575442 RepID=A0A4V6XBH3_9ACTN|nr:malto-oligosyltrehalose synthase [Herbidospora galbida]